MVKPKPTAVTATIGLGTNLGDKVANIAQAEKLLVADGAVRVVARSRLYRSEPWGGVDQDWFVNAALRVETALSPHDLLARCQAVEAAMGRIREVRWGPRIIDVDILTYDAQTVRAPDLSIPHPLIASRAFVLLPLRDVAPDVRIAGHKLDALIAKLGDAGTTLL